MHLLILSRHCSILLRYIHDVPGRLLFALLPLKRPYRCTQYILSVLQVTAHLDANNILTIEAQDLDSGRHHLWKHGGGSVVADGIHASELNTNGHYVVDYSQSQAVQQPIRA